jgi:uncharacterized protein YidB (DUF937 family)
MGLLDTLKAATGAVPAADTSQSSLVSAVLSTLAAQPGGIQGLIQQFHAKGLAGIISSWVGKGQNLPISPEQVQGALGSQQVEAIAAKAGISPEAAKAGLAQYLPQIIDHLTPNGEIPEGDVMSKGMELLKGKLFS